MCTVGNLKCREVNSRGGVGKTPNTHLKGQALGHLGRLSMALHEYTTQTHSLATHLLDEHVGLRHDPLNTAQVIGHTLLALLPHSVSIQQERLA